MRDAIFFLCLNLKLDYFILTIMSDNRADSDCTICVTNNGAIANVDKDFDLSDISVSSEGMIDLTDFVSFCLSDNNNGDVDVHVDDNNNTFSNVLKPIVLQYVFVQFFIITQYHTDLWLSVLLPVIHLINTKLNISRHCNFFFFIIVIY